MSSARLRTVDAGTVVGEKGLYADAPRSASLIAEQPTTVEPDIAAALAELCSYWRRITLNGDQRLIELS